MSTEILVSQDVTVKNNIRLTNQRNPIIDRKERNLLQWTKPKSFNPVKIGLGSRTSVEVSLASKDEHGNTEQSHFIRYAIKNKHATESITMHQGPFTHFEKIKITINKNAVLEVKGRDTFKELYNEYLLERGTKIYLDSAFVRDELETTNGVTIPPLSSHVFYFPLDLILSFSGTTAFIQRKPKDFVNIKDIEIEITPTDEVTNASKAGLLCSSSSATVNMRTRDNIEFENLEYIRSFFVNPSKNMVVPFFAPNKRQSVMLYETKEKVVYSGVWNKSASSSCTFTTDSIGTFKNIQHYHIFARVKPTTFDSTECEKEYSGYHYSICYTK